MKTDLFIHTIDSRKFQTSLSTWIGVQTKIKKVSEAKVTFKYPSKKKKTFANPLQNTFFWCPKTIFPFGLCFFFSSSISPFDPSLQTTRLGLTFRKA